MAQLGALFRAQRASADVWLGAAPGRRCAPQGARNGGGEKFNETCRRSTTGIGSLRPVPHRGPGRVSSSGGAGAGYFRARAAGIERAVPNIREGGWRRRPSVVPSTSPDGWPRRRRLSRSGGVPAASSSAAGVRVPSGGHPHGWWRLPAAPGAARAPTRRWLPAASADGLRCAASWRLPAAAAAAPGPWAAVLRRAAAAVALRQLVARVPFCALTLDLVVAMPRAPGRAPPRRIVDSHTCGCRTPPAHGLAGRLRRCACPFVSASALLRVSAPILVARPPSSSCSFAKCATPTTRCGSRDGARPMPSPPQGPGGRGGPWGGAPPLRVGRAIRRRRPRAAAYDYRPAPSAASVRY